MSNDLGDIVKGCVECGMVMSIETMRCPYCQADQPELPAKRKVWPWVLLAALAAAALSLVL